MKFNKWTLGLAAVGAVSMASAVRADEAKLSAVQTALTGTTISGYVDVGVQYNLGDQSRYSSLPPYANNYNGNTGRDGFALKAINIALEKPLDDAPWAAGYRIELNAGDDSIHGTEFYQDEGGSGDAGSGWVGVRQAYIALRTPVGNGITWKLGVFDGVTGYESNTGYANPNITRSYGYIINPTTFLGLIGSYSIVDGVSVQLGIANRGSYQGHGQTDDNLSSKDYIAAISLSAPESWGWLKGSALNVQTVQAFDNEGVNIYSANASLATPVAGFKLGLAYDTYVSLADSHDGSIYGVYATYQATDKLSFALRGELIDAQELAFDNTFGDFGKGYELTATVQYDLWANVITRAEFRWDRYESKNNLIGGSFSNNETQNAFLLALNAVYKF